MTVHQISYDLHRPTKDYEGLYKDIQALGDVRHPMLSMWWVSSQLTASQIADRIRKHLDANDTFFISRVTVDHQGWLPKAEWEWLNGRLG